MAKSEIDDIFASASAVVASSSSKPSAGQNKKTKKDKKRKRAAADEDVAQSERRPPAPSSPPASTSAKKAKAAPETVFDPSVRAPQTSTAAAQPRRECSKATSAKVAKRATGIVRASKGENADDADDRFKDSRGIGPRRKTDEGFSVFKEAELGIDPEAGGTPLCPFDCDCCF